VVIDRYGWHVQAVDMSYAEETVEVNLTYIAWR